MGKGIKKKLQSMWQHVSWAHRLSWSTCNIPSSCPLTSSTVSVFLSMYMSQRQDRWKEPSLIVVNTKPFLEKWQKLPVSLCPLPTTTITRDRWNCGSLINRWLLSHCWVSTGNMWNVCRSMKLPTIFSLNRSLKISLHCALPHKIWRFSKIWP